MKRNLVMTWALVVGFLPLAACGPTTTDSGGDGANLDLAKLAVDNTEHALLGAHSAGSFIADSQTFADAFSSLDGGETCETSDCLGDPACVPQTVCTPNEVTIADLQEQYAELRDGIDDFILSLREDFFAKENLESSTGSSVTYRLGPSVLCGEVEAPTAPGEPAPGPSTTPMYDEECVEQSNRLQVRLRLTLASPGNVDMAVLLTEAKRNPVTFELYRDHVGVTTDLAEVKATLDAAGEDTTNLPVLEGRLGLELRRNAELDWSFVGNVLQNVVVAVADEETGEQVQVSVGASAPSMELRLNGNARNILGAIDFGAITAGGPLNAFRDNFDQVEYDPVTGEELARPTYTGNVELMLAGYEGSVSFDGSTDHLTLAGLGMGDVASTLKWNDQLLAQFDLNKERGRHFDLGYQKTNAGSELTFSPTLDALLSLNFAPLQAQIPDISPSLLNDSLHVWFDGQDPKIEVADNQVKVVSGTFNVTSTATPDANLTVPAGMCLVDSGATDPTNEAIGTLVTGACE